MKTVALALALSICLFTSSWIRVSGADPGLQAPVVIPMGEMQAADPSVLPAPSGVPAPYACTMPQEDIKARVLMALSFAKQGSYAKSQHVLQLLLNDL